MRRASDKLEITAFTPGAAAWPADVDRDSPVPAMRLLPLTRRAHEPALRLSRRELATLRRWLDATARAELAAATPRPGRPGGLPLSAAPVEGAIVALSIAERRDRERSPLQTLAELRPISAGGIGPIRPAAVCDVSSEGLALRTAEPLEDRQRLSLEIHPPFHLPRRRFGRAEPPIRLLAVVRYCRTEPPGYVVGCSIGVAWADTLAHQMFPADLPALRKSA